MSVYTIIEEQELRQFLLNYEVGDLKSFQGISDGIENTNYFVDTSAGRFVLTVFEHHDLNEMQYYLKLMHHLSDHGVPSADPVADKQGKYLSLFQDKPIALVERLDGGSITQASVEHCAQIGAAMGKMHSAGLSYKHRQENPRGLVWCQQTATRVMEKLSTDEQVMLATEIHFLTDKRDATLPRGVIHADLFRDNALWSKSEDSVQLSGIIDFYYSCDDTLLYDLAVTANDWCNNNSRIGLNQEKVSALLVNYHQHRPLTEAEQQYWPVMLRAGALRFWLSRLQDKHFPRPGELVHTKNPDAFKAILSDRINNSQQYLYYWK